MSRAFLLFLFSTILLSFSIPSETFAADCSSPDGNEAEIDYFVAENVYKFCNGTEWVSMVDTGGGSGSPGTAPRYYRFFGTGACYRSGAEPYHYAFHGKTTTGDYGYPSSTNWAGGTASASGYDSGREPYRAKPGDGAGSNSAWIDSSPVNAGVGKWWAIDLGPSNTEIIRSIGYEPYSSTSQSHMWSTFDFQASLDGTTWHTVKSYTGMNVKTYYEAGSPVGGHDVPDHYFDDSGNLVLPMEF